MPRNLYDNLYDTYFDGASHGLEAESGYRIWAFGLTAWALMKIRERGVVRSNREAGVKGIIKGADEYDFSGEFVVRSPDGKTGYIAITNMIFILTFDPVAAAKAALEAAKSAEEDCAHRGQPKVGMSPSEAAATCWGRPLRIAKITTAKGVQEIIFMNAGISFGSKMEFLPQFSKLSGDDFGTLTIL